MLGFWLRNFGPNVYFGCAQNLIYFEHSAKPQIATLFEEIPTSSLKITGDFWVCSRRLKLSQMGLLMVFQTVKGTNLTYPKAISIFERRFFGAPFSLPFLNSFFLLLKRRLEPVHRRFYNYYNKLIQSNKTFQKSNESPTIDCNLHWTVTQVFNVVAASFVGQVVPEFIFLLLFILLLGRVCSVGQVVQVIPVGRILAVDIVAPVADTEPLVEACLVAAHVRDPATILVAHVENLAVKFQIGIETYRLVSAVESEADIRELRPSPRLANKIHFTLHTRFEFNSGHSLLFYYHYHRFYRLSSAVSLPNN